MRGVLPLPRPRRAPRRIWIRFRALKEPFPAPCARRRCAHGGPTAEGKAVSAGEARRCWRGPGARANGVRWPPNLLVPPNWAGWRGALDAVCGRAAAGCGRAASAVCSQVLPRSHTPPPLASAPPHCLLSESVHLEPAHCAEERARHLLGGRALRAWQHSLGVLAAHCSRSGSPAALGSAQQSSFIRSRPGFSRRARGALTTPPANGPAPPNRTHICALPAHTHRSLLHRSPALSTRLKCTFVMLTKSHLSPPSPNQTERKGAALAAAAATSPAAAHPALASPSTQNLQPPCGGT